MPSRGRRTLGIEFSGPFFRHDPVLTYRENVRAYMDRIAEVGEAEVKRRLTGSREAAHTRPHVRGRTESLTGKHWAATARVSVDTSDLAIGKRNPAAMRRMAIAAGRHNPIATYRQVRPTGLLGLGGTRAVVTGTRYIGTTLGAEGRTHAFRDAKSAVLRAARDNVGSLLEGLR